jgi:PAS domain S-box-containing protein
MKTFKKLSIKNKLVAIIVLVTTLAVVSGFTVDILRTNAAMRSELLHSTELHAKLLGEYCVVPLTFDDQEEAVNVLAKLRSLPSIESGYLYDAKGGLFAAFEREGDTPPPHVPEAGEQTAFEGGYLHTYEPIIYNHQKYGAVYLRTSTATLDQKIKENAFATIAIVLILIGISYLLALRLQGLISNPILELARVTKTISDEGDYSLRVQRGSTDEIGVLYDGFNDMLGQIHAREVRVNLLLNSTAEAIYGLDLTGNCTFCNAACVRILGYNKEEDLLDKNMHDLIHHSHADGSPYPIRECRIFRSFQDGVDAHVDDEVLWRADGTQFKAEYWSYSMQIENNIVGSVVTFVDITERKETEQRIADSLAEKEVLLKEIHHRVKNNLQIISSLLNLQSAQIEDEEVQSLFAESRSRVTAIALIHEKLYRSENLAEICFDDYIQSLVSTLTDSFGTQAGPVKIEVAAHDVSLSVDTAIPCALIITELVTNALKYAFHAENPSNKPSPEIRVEMFWDQEDRILLRVSDNGCGLPPDLDFRNTESLGLQIVNTLTEQIDGVIELHSEDGVTFEIRFQAASPAPTLR